MKNILGKRIELERIRLGLNQIELAKKLNLSSSASISQYESGDRIPSDDIKLKMCEIFNCSLDYLMGKSDIRNPLSIDEDKINLAFSSGYNGLNETNKNIINATIAGLLAKQESDEAEKKEKNKEKKNEEK